MDRFSGFNTSICLPNLHVVPSVGPNLRGEMVKRGQPGVGLLMVACSGFYVGLKPVDPLLRF